MYNTLLKMTLLGGEQKYYTGTSTYTIERKHISMQNEYECMNNFLTHLIKCETNWEGLSLINIVPIFPCQIPFNRSLI